MALLELLAGFGAVAVSSDVSLRLGPEGASMLSSMDAFELLGVPRRTLKLSDVLTCWQ